MLIMLSRPGSARNIFTRPIADTGRPVMAPVKDHLSTDCFLYVIFASVPDIVLVIIHEEQGFHLIAIGCTAWLNRLNDIGRHRAVFVQMNFVSGIFSYEI